ncbi:MAG: hypothetical protein ACPG1A_05070 [Halioglobus sp.]
MRNFLLALGMTLVLLAAFVCLWASGEGDNGLFMGILIGGPLALPGFWLTIANWPARDTG